MNQGIIIYNDDDDGYYYEVRADGDGLRCVEVVYNVGRNTDKDEPPGYMSPEMALKVAECMIRLAYELINRDATQ